ncbi:hypothetical protein E4P40_14380 [Blastococcus sp. CT_GayMR20]|uniref:hypothetical protein n=1 Tax=Blastococcus sp. CT_GayMR20 TaxID=2559609 RepID=UPI001073EEF2|nr:hypothetical protein [Blastococcus sp. CT_GayMR20]TFV83251.1 hypothetical protein E4P40_14380 [Blastococcus sp. CT_GayMR20]
MSAPRYLLVGAASELSLRPLAVELRSRGLSVSVVDLAVQELGPADLPPGDGPLVMITSQHLGLTGQAYDTYYAIHTNVATPPALKVAVGADLLVYVPHDLGDPVLHGEMPLLSLLDLYVAPDDSTWWATAHVPTVVAGWVASAGAERFPAPQEVLHRGVLFVSAVKWIMSRGGGPFLVDALRHTLAHGLAVKLPDWPGVEGLEDALRGAGAVVVDRQAPAAALIAQAPLVVSTASGSIIAEAALAGHRPVCVAPTGGERELTGDVAEFDVITCSDEEFPEAVGRAGRVRPGSGSFDTDLFLTAVRDRLEALARD